MFKTKCGFAAGTLIVATMFSAIVVCGQQPAATTEAARTKIDLGYVTPDAFAVVVAYPRHVLTAAEMDILPTEVFTAGGKRDMGIDPVDIEQILGVAELAAGGPPSAAAVFKTAGLVPEGKIFPPVWEKTQEAQLEGKPYRQGIGPTDASIFRADEHTLLLGHDAMIRKMLANHAAPKEGKMTQVLGRIVAPADLRGVVLVEPLRPLLGPAMMMAPVPPAFAEAKQIPELLNSVAVKVNMTGTTHTSLMLRANDEAAAQQLEAILNRLLQNGRQELMKQVEKESKSNDPVEQAAAKYVERVSNRMLQLFRPTRNGAAVTLAIDGSNAQMQSLATGSILAGMLLPAVASARAAARRAQSMNNLKQIGLAMHNYAAAKGSFPARAIFAKQGKPLLSWRVELLPYLDEIELYKEFHLDEPWDSQHNRKLMPRMPQVFASSSVPGMPGLTNYLAVCGEGLAFDGSKGRRLADFKAGLGGKILALETERCVDWTKPDDWQPDPKRPLAGVSRVRPGGFNALYADGHVQFIPNTIDVKLFWSLLTVGGSEKSSKADPFGE
jgi:prepilin-type processing-associated H-X9-DG protein